VVHGRRGSRAGDNRRRDDDVGDTTVFVPHYEYRDLPGAVRLAGEDLRQQSLEELISGIAEAAAGQAKKEVQKRLRKSVTKTIAAFFNTEGGMLLIGVGDSGKVLVIEPEFEYLKLGKQDADGWLLSLKDVIINALGTEACSTVHASLVPRGQETVAVVTCPPRAGEAWRRGDGSERFYIRTSNATHELHGSSLLRYIRERWPG
jgi:hypothetical protein